MQATFPYLAALQSAQFHLDGQLLDIQTSISNVQTVIPTMRGKWMATVTFALMGEERTLQWEAFLAQMEGRIGTTLVPAYSPYLPKDRDGHEVSFSDVAGVSGSQTMELWGLKGSDVLRVSVASAASLRATQIDVNYHNTTGLRPGHKFSIGERLHRVQTVYRVGSVHRVLFQPPLRGPVAAGVRIETDKPVCRMRMVSETEGVSAQGTDLLPSVQVQFQEAL